MKIKRMAAGFLAVAMFASMALTPAWAEELTDYVVANDLTDTASDEPSGTDVLDEDENPNPPQLFTDTAAEGSASLGAEDNGTSVETAEDEPKDRRPAAAKLAEKGAMRYGTFCGRRPRRTGSDHPARCGAAANGGLHYLCGQPGQPGAAGAGQSRLRHL